MFVINAVIFFHHDENRFVIFKTIQKESGANIRQHPQSRVWTPVCKILKNKPHLVGN